MSAGMNDTPSANRVHIGIFGKRNAGKSSVMNALTNQQIAIVSDIMGTTTDPVVKAMELLPIGPVVMTDTPGIDDDSGELGAMRVKKSYQALNKTDIAIVVIDGENESPEDTELIGRIKAKNIPFVVFHNKSDLMPEGHAEKEGHIYGCALDKTGIEELRSAVARLAGEEDSGRKLISDLLKPLDTVVLVIPIDAAAPKGRLILPQQQTIRDILECGACAVCVKDTELEQTLAKLGTKPRIVVTDSQVFRHVAAVTPEDVPLTSFSILFARYRGMLKEAVTGAAEISKLKSGDRVLVSEGCTHRRQCGDIGTVKIPNLIKKFTGADCDFVFASGTEFPDDPSRYRLVIHCGACMLNEREVRYRYRSVRGQGVPITNYGTALAYMNGILKRSVEPFNEAKGLL